MAIAVPSMQQVDPAQATATTVDPTTVAQSQTSLTSDQLSGVLSSGSQLMQQSATMGNQQAAQRGLLNSSMGIQAAQNAMIQNATPIAQANANALNQSSQFNAQSQNQQTTANQQAQNSIAQSNVQQQNATNTWSAGQTNEALMKSMDLDSREQLMGVEANYKTLMQVNSSASGMYEQMLKNMADIQGSKDMDAGTKASAIQNQLTYLRTGMTMLQNMNNITGLVTF